MIILINIITNYLNYYKIKIITLNTYTNAIDIKDIVYPKTHKVKMNKVILNNILHRYNKRL